MKLSVNNLSKTYSNGVKALDNVSFNTGSGMFGLLGPNGAGKSTLMRTIATLQQPDSGKISFNDIDVLNDPFSLRKVLGYLPQEFGVYPKTSAEDLLEYFASLKGIGLRSERKRIIQHVLEITNLYDVRKKHVDGYSGGMKQRFGIAQLLLNKPELIIVDEPTAGLDPAERNRFLNVLRHVGTMNTVIFSTHIVEDVTDLCTSFAILNGGKILQQSSPAEAVKALENRIWIKPILHEELERYESIHNVISSKFNTDNSITIRVNSLNQPADEFILTTPKLEDVYFTALKNHQMSSA